MRQALDVFLENLNPRGDVEIASGGAWICLHEDTVTLDGEFTPHELIQIIAALNREPKK